MSNEPVHYLSEFEVAVPAREFERGIDNFMDLVLRRLDKVGKTELHVLWQDVLAERADGEQSTARKIEARLGYDADEASLDLLERFLNLATEAGADTTDEIAPVCAGSDPVGVLQNVISLASRPGIQGRISLPAQAGVPNGALPPWQRARQFATAVRRSLGLGVDPLNDKTLSELLQISADDLNAKPSAHAPMGLAVRTGTQDLKLLFHKRNRPARRFEAARFIADYISAGGSDRWLPITDSGTARQKLQRAFAAEFLCPIDSLRSYLGDDFLPEAFEDAAEHFGISEMAIKSHLANHHLIPRTLVDSDTTL
ncbi:MAG: hypothetical protein ABSB35_36950 [Bryobacteraceae bacterium]